MSGSTLDPFPNIELDTVLVTGGTGFLGSNIVRLFLANPYKPDIHVLARNLPPPSKTQAGVTYHPGSITDESFISSLFGKIKPTVIVHTISPKYTSSSTLLHSVYCTP
jgi:sterol-4alpha-carboxylate 3-dehydrogenase (decarboxylating)